MVPKHAAASLGEFELLVLLSTLSLGDTAYPVSIAADIETRTGRTASRTAVLITLERLQDKGLLTSRYGDPTPVRGGRAKRYFRARPQALHAVRQSLARIKTMTAGLESVLKLP
jgi:PadR family transcriptional regulator, regulatory protein PadR